MSSPSKNTIVARLRGTIGHRKPQVCCNALSRHASETSGNWSSLYWWTVRHRDSGHIGPLRMKIIMIVDFHVYVKSSHASKTSLSVQSYSQSSHDSCVSYKLLFKRPKNNSYDLTNLGKLPSRLVLSIDNLITFQQLDKVGAQSPFQPLLLSAFISDYR